MIVSLLAAASENNVIGKDNKLPWHLPDDLKRFKALTRGHAIIMGRKTFDSIGRPLPERTNIVVSRQLEVAPVGCELAHSLNDAIRIAKPTGDEVFIIGGADIYSQAIDLADRIYLTRVHATIDGDAFFPEIESEWVETEREEHLADEKHQYSFSFITYRRK